MSLPGGLRYECVPQANDNSPRGSEGAQAASLQLQASTARNDSPTEQDANPVYHVLETDVYSLCLVFPKGWQWDIVAFIVPLIGPGFQLSFLWFLARDHTNIFQEGRWLGPGSAQSDVLLMKGLCVMATVFKAYTELNCNVSLAIGVAFCEISALRRYIGWLWCVTQYLVMMGVLVCAVSLVLGAQSTVACITKSITVNLVIDLDNLVAMFFAASLGLYTDGFFKAPFKNNERKTRSDLFSGTTPSAMGSVWAFFYLSLPLLLMAFEVGTAMRWNTLPLTWLRMGGLVSNDFPPELTIAAASCCPPIQVPDADGDESTKSYTVLVFDRIEQEARQPPMVHWVVLEAMPEPFAPTSYQITNGQDGNDNMGHGHGAVTAAPVQARQWLREHAAAGGFDGESAYQALVEDLRLHERVAPFVASIKVSGLESFGHSYRVYVTAENTATRALSCTPLASGLLVMSVCPLHCERCRSSKRCDLCTEGFFLTQHGICVACIEHCRNCSQNAENWVRAKNLTAALSGVARVPCDPGQCKPGHGLDEEGLCIPCGVSRCAICDRNNQSVAVLHRCDECMPGYSVNIFSNEPSAGNDSENSSTQQHWRCDPCGDTNCIACDTSASCSTCNVGYGLTGPSTNRTCKKCGEGCKDCYSSDVCIECKDAYVNISGTCTACVDHCLECPSGALSCDVCAEGYGVYNGQCNWCQVERCAQCDTAYFQTKCTKCAPDYGLNAENTSCVKCGEFCTSCTRAGECAACTEGYALKKTSEDADAGGVQQNRKECWPCPDGCQRCSMCSRCDQCSVGFQLTGDGQCLTKNERVFALDDEELNRTMLKQVDHIEV